MNAQPVYLASKPHYEILDGLRGVAALMVVPRLGKQED